MTGPAIDWDMPNAAADLAPGYAGPPAGFLETVQAARQSYDAQRLSTTRNYYAGRLGKDVVGALRRRGRTGFTGADGRKVAYGDDALRSDYILNPTVAPRIWADVAAEQARDPAFLKGIDGPEAFDDAILTARRRDYDESAEVLGRSGGATGLAGELAGGLIAAAGDPLQVGALAVTAGLPAGRLGMGVLQKLFGGRLGLGVATRIAGEAIGNAGVNVAATAPTLPVAMARSEEIGVPMTGRDIAIELGVAGVAGGVMGGGAAAIGAGAKAAAAPMSVRRMARALKALDRPLTGAEADALTVLETAAADIGSSPYPPTPMGDAVHSARLSEAVDALEADRPIAAELFAAPAPAPVRSFEPAFIERVRRYAADPKAGPLTPDAVARVLGVKPEVASDVLSALAAGSRGRGVIVAGAKGFRRPLTRRGAVDLLTTIGDAGGIARTGVAEGSTSAGHDLLGTMGQRMIPGAGPLFRKNGGMTIDALGGWLHERGWFPGVDRPTEADVLDLLDRGMREKLYHPDEASDVADGWATDANAEWEASKRSDIAGAAGELGVRLNDEDMRAVLQDVAGEVEPAAAVEAHINRQLEEAMFEARALIDGDDYEAAFFGDADRAGLFGEDRASGQDRGGRAPGAGDAGEGAAGGREYAGAGRQQDAIPGAVERAAGDEALKAFDAPQGDGAAAQIEALAHDLRAEIADPAIAERARQALTLRSAAPIRAKTGQADMADTALFGQVDAFAMADGKVVTPADLLAEIDADDAALAIMKNCL